MDDSLARGVGTDFAVRLRGARTPAIALGATALLVLGVIEVAIGGAGHLARWWWAPMIMVLPVVLMMFHGMRGVLVRSDGGDLVVERLLSRRRIPASTISSIHLAGIVNERIEVVRDTGRTWTFTAADSPEADRLRVVGLAQRWLDAHGGPVPVQSGPLRDGERLGFCPGRDDWWQATTVVVVELVAAAVCVRRLVDSHGLGVRHWATVALLLMCLATIAEMVAGLVRVATTVQGDDIVVRRGIASTRRIRAADVESMQVTMRGSLPGVRVFTRGRWVALPLHMQALDHPRAVLRLTAWLQLHGAHLSISNDVPGRGDRDELVPLGLVLVSFVGMTWLLGAYSRGLGGLWVVAGTLAVSALTRTRALDPSRIDETRGLAWSFQR